MWMTPLSPCSESGSNPRWNPTKFHTCLYALNRTNLKQIDVRSSLLLSCQGLPRTFHQWWNLFPGSSSSSSSPSSCLISHRVIMGPFLPPPGCHLLSNRLPAKALLKPSINNGALRWTLSPEDLLFLHILDILPPSPPCTLCQDLPFCSYYSVAPESSTINIERIGGSAMYGMHKSSDAV